MMKPYESYKETNIPWLNEVPSHWEERRAKYLFKKETRLPLEEDEVVTCFRDGQVTLRRNRRLTGFTESIKEHGYQHVQKGDLVIHVMDAFAGAIGVSDSSGKCTPVYSVCSSLLNSNIYYYAHIVREMAKTGFIQSLYRGIRERSSDFRFEVFSAQLLPILPRDEQDKIVAYLDWQLSKINKLVKSKKRQIELLKEHKQAVINKAVTKGLDDSVDMKESGVEWLGKIPKHWEVERLKKYVVLHNEKTAKSDLKYIGMENIESWTGLYIDSANIVPESISNVFYKDCLLFGKLRPYLAKAYITQEKGICSSEFLVMSTSGFNITFLKYMMLSKTFIDIVTASTYGAKMPRANWNFIGNVYIPIPNSQEQQAIVDYLTDITGKIDTTISEIEQEIELLSEYKTSLISSVVTGKVDVRDIVIPEYEKVEEDISDDIEETETNPTEQVDE